MEREFIQWKASPREGGVSVGPYASFNMGENVGDDPLSVEENQRRFFKEMGVTEVAKLNQVHGTRVVVVDEGGVYEGDALITQKKGLALMVRYADCQGAVFYDKEKDQIACAHAGWRGLVANIYSEVVKALNTDPKKITVWIAPSLGPKHSFYPEFPEMYRPFMEKPHYYNFWDLAEKQLQDLGIKNIYIERKCSYEHPEAYYSYKRDQVTGRHASLIEKRGE